MALRSLGLLDQPASRPTIGLIPALPKTSEEDVVAAARQLVAKGGAAALSMQDVAAAVGVRASSLYKRFADRQAILNAVAHEVLMDMDRLQRKVAVTGSPMADLRAIVHALRKFATRNRHLYELVLGPTLGQTPFAASESAASVEILLDRVGQLTGPANALQGARLLVAFAHGFITLELAGAFRLGGRLDEAFEFGLTKLLESLGPVR